MFCVKIVIDKNPDEVFQIHFYVITNVFNKKLADFEMSSR